MNPLVSIVVPVYNVEDYLEDALNCLINQTYDNLEIIIVNDGSTDDSSDICAKYDSQYSSIRIIHQENRGLSEARNTGINYCNGKYIYFFDSDDLLELTAIEKLVLFSEKTKVDLVLMDASVFGETLNINKEAYFHTDLNNHAIYSIEDFCKKNNKFNAPVWLYFYKASLILSNNLRFEPGILHEDELFTPIVLAKASNIGYISESFFKRRYRPNSIMTSTSNEYLHSLGYEKVVRELKLLENTRFSEQYVQFINERMERCVLGMITKGNSTVVDVYKLSKELNLPYLKIIGQATNYQLRKKIKKIIKK
ncbi:glycosyltransferase [Enterococcus saccharolyticus]|uniref:Glycosyltransferase 2-like domain-containing protein n=1 Tax=Enterococcus saccharolyticus subsp. saccharolyticus ATCC 43076 TaxID=1139996 RepID=S0NVW7_9ENTE|nr:glycosyltransferase [Enterococcus saccharolyticus]EOT30780.1 hypothetical protein OMQ_00484 [Enterococcus saccharolyticus subsp. saccharolyticus ATCC 43076]EOT80341.1 hypothetical protein I572_00866 [Enterococcus saccharolyticus subsp. saccharolyticus ATCC 43076]OJG85686.1 hypothetical protein RV16_GL001327 [Enterococcus saccharolyticus]